jgi:hypothetical protein
MSFTNDEITKIKRSICLVYLNKQRSFFQTAWLVSGSGFLLTAGHGICEHKLKVNDCVDITFFDGFTCDATIVDFGFRILEPNKSSIDYALLKLNKRSSRNALPLKLLKSLNSVANKDLLIVGYRSDNVNGEIKPQTIVRGRVESISKSSDGNPFFIQLYVQGKGLHGMSGAPVCIKQNGQIFAIGLQCLQDNQYNSDAFACPVDHIYKNSLLFKDLYHQTLYRSRIDLDSSVILTCSNMSIPPRFVDTSNVCRSIIFIEPPGIKNSPYAFPIRNKLWDKWERYTTIGKQKCTFDTYLQGKPSSIFPGEHLKGLKLSVQKSFLSSNTLGSGSKVGNNYEITNKSFREILLTRFGSSSDSLRIICDLDNILSPRSFAELWSDEDSAWGENRITHLVLVQLGSDNGLDSFNNILIITIKTPEANEVEKTIQALFNIIEDVILDICIANSMRHLFSLYSSVVSKRIFSKAKAEFAYSQIKSPYQISNTSMDLPYISFASCTRKSLHSEIQPEMYYNLWKDFLDHEFLPIGTTSCIHRFDPVNFSQVANYILDLRGIWGQVSINRLKHEFSLAISKNQSSKFFFFAIYTRRAKSKINRKTLAHLFGRQKCRLKMFRFFPSYRLHELVLYRDNIRISLFKLA